MEAGDELIKSRKVANTWMGVRIPTQLLTSLLHCTLLYQFPREGAYHKLSAVWCPFFIQKSVIVRMKFANNWMKVHLSTIYCYIFFTASLLFKGLIKNQQLFEVYFLLQNVFLCLLLNLYVIQNSLVFHVIQLSDKRSMIRSKPSIRDGVLRSGMLLYLHLILK